MYFMGESCGAFRYRSRDRVKGPLFRVVLDHLEEFAVRLVWPQDCKPRPHPAIIERFRKYIECGLMRFVPLCGTVPSCKLLERDGVVRFRCPKCGEDAFASFSCKIRGLCPSCDAKRATATMANAGERLLPEVGYRQWVLVVPKRLRFIMNLHAELAGEVAAILARCVELYLRRKAGEGSPAHTTSMTHGGAR